MLELSECLNKVNTPFDLYIFDNSPKDSYKDIFQGENVFYFHQNDNIGFAAANNYILNKVKGKYPIHLLINPDVVFEEGTVEKLVDYLLANKSIKQIIPQIKNPDQSIQFTYKVFPRPMDLFARRFLPSKYNYKRNAELSLTHSLNGKVEEIPFMSGCFMMFKTEVLEEVGLFDERFFLYLEDLDFSWRISRKFKSVYYPSAKIIHKHKKGSYKHLKLLRHHIVSTIKFYNKYGWFPLWKKQGEEKQVHAYNRSN